MTEAESQNRTNPLLDELTPEEIVQLRRQVRASRMGREACVAAHFSERT